MSEQEQQVLQVIEAYRGAVYAKDAEAFARLYTPEVRVFDLWGQWSHEGCESWHAMAREWFESLGDEKVTVDVDELRVHLAADLAVAHGYVKYTGWSAAGDRLRFLSNRATWVLERRDGQWRIAHEHTSAPLHHETGKAMLQRE